MSDEATRRMPHSAEYFGAERDYFWNADYLDLLFGRLGLPQPAAILDVGCGEGHWARLVAGRLSPGSSVTGVDREAVHLAAFERGLATTETAGLSVSTLQASAYDIPAPSATFDLVTCQTLLLHLREPAKALGEMKRLVKPGGQILCVEPNNLVGRLPISSLMSVMPVDEVVRLSEFALRYVIGRARRGLGDETIGESLPGLLAEAGLQDIRVWLCDRAAAVFPPYDTAEQAALLDAGRRWRREGLGPFDKAEMRSCVLAGEGSEAFFERAWADYLRLDDRIAEAAANGRWHTAGGTLFYVAAGRRGP